VQRLTPQKRRFAMLPKITGSGNPAFCKSLNITFTVRKTEIVHS